MNIDCTSVSDYSFHPPLEEPLFLKTEIDQKREQSSLQSLKTTAHHSKHTSLWNPIKAFFAQLFAKAPETPKVVIKEQGLLLELDGEKWKQVYCKETETLTTLTYFPHRTTSNIPSEVFIVSTVHDSKAALIDVCVEHIEKHKEYGGCAVSYDIYQQTLGEIKYELSAPTYDKSSSYAHCIEKLFKKDNSLIVVTYVVTGPQELNDLRTKWDPILDSYSELLLLS